MHLATLLPHSHAPAAVCFQCDLGGATMLPLGHRLALSLVCGIGAAIAEALPLGLDDNLVMPIAAAAFMWPLFHWSGLPGADYLYGYPPS